MRIQKLLTALVLMVLVSPAFAVTAKDVESQIAQAEKLRKQAASMGAEWRDTKKHIGQAEKLLKDGKLDKAMSKAKFATFESEAAMEQKKDQDKNWKINIPF